MIGLFLSKFPVLTHPTDQQWRLPLHSSGSDLLIMDAHITITSVIMFINNDAYLVRISGILHNVSERFNVDPQICVADRLKASMRQCWSISGQWLLRSSLSCIANKHHQSTWSVHNWYICHVSNWQFSWILGRLPYTNSTPHSWCLNMPQPSWASIWQPLYKSINITQNGVLNRASF